MTAKRKSTKRAVKRPSKRKAPARRQKKAAAGAKRATRRSRRAAKAPKKAPKKAPRRAPGEAAPAERTSAPSPVPVSAFSLDLVQVAPLRYEAAAALGRLETVQLIVGTSDDGVRVETLLFAPTGKAVQSQGEYVHRGEWNGSRLLTDKGHLLDADGSCFCRDCEAAGGYTLDDDE
jgi:hypothetical protein